MVAESKYSMFPAQYEYALMKRAILQFAEGAMTLALKDISEFLASNQKHVGCEGANLASFVGLLTAGACHQLQKQKQQAKHYYQNANTLVSQPNCQLLLQNPMLETTLWNLMDDWLHPEEDTCRIELLRVVGHSDSS